MPQSWRERATTVFHCEKQPAVVIDIEQTLLLFDHHVASGRSIAVQGVDSPSDRGGDIVLLDHDVIVAEPVKFGEWKHGHWAFPILTIISCPSLYRSVKSTLSPTARPLSIALSLTKNSMIIRGINPGIS